MLSITRIDFPDGRVLSSLTSALIAFNPQNETKISMTDKEGITEDDKIKLGDFGTAKRFYPNDEDLSDDNKVGTK